MRSRLLNCNSDQLRPATRREEFGELQELSEQLSSHRAGAVDVTKDGTPPLEVAETSSLGDQVSDISLLPLADHPSQPLRSIPEGREIPDEGTSREREVSLSFEIEKSEMRLLEELEVHRFDKSLNKRWKNPRVNQCLQEEPANLPAPLHQQRLHRMLRD